jgi:membrane fusion protein, multidrug efflux system
MWEALERVGVMKEVVVLRAVDVNERRQKRRRTPAPISRQAPWTSAVLASCLGLVALAVTGCGRPRAMAKGSGAVPVRVASAVTMDVPVAVEAIGFVEPYNSVTIVPRVGGQLLKRHFREGDQVAPGQLLFTIDTAPHVESLRQAEARLARDEADLEFSRVEAQRYKSLTQKGFTSASDGQRLDSQAVALEQVVRAQQAEVEQARLNLSYCEVRSPIAGRAGAYLVYEGGTVEAYRTSLLVINQTRPVKVAFSVAEAVLAQVRAVATATAPAVTVRIPGNAAVAGTGRVNFVDNTVDVSSGMVTLKAELANEDEMFWPGQYVNVTVTLAEQHGVVVVPARALQAGPSGRHLFVVNADGAAELRRVVVVRWHGDQAVIEEGVAAGESVIVDGQNKVKQGAKVQATPAEADAAPGPGAAAGQPSGK